MRHIFTIAIILTLLILCVLFFYSDPATTMEEQQGEAVNPQMMETDTTDPDSPAG